MYQQLGVPKRKLEGSRLIKGKIQEKGKQSLMSKGVPYY